MAGHPAVPRVRPPANDAHPPYYAWLHARGHRSDNPALLLPVPPKPTRLPRAISEDDLMRAVAQAPPRLLPWLLLAGWSGMRASDIASMRRDRIHIDERGQRYARVIGKGDLERDVPIPAWVWERIEPAMAVEGWCWRRVRGPGAGVEPPTAQHVSQYLSAYLHKLGITESAHALRHRAAQRTLDDTGSARLVQSVLGHRDLSTVQVYTRVSPQDAAAALERLPRPIDAPARTATPPSAGRTGSGTSVLRLTNHELDAHTSAWLDTYRSSETREAYRRDTDIWRTWLAEQNIHPLDARRSDAERWRTWLEHGGHRHPDGRQAGYSPSTIARRMSGVSSWYRYFTGEGLAVDNPLQGVTVPPQRLESTTLWLAQEEATRLLDAAEEAGPLESAIIWLLLASGMRVSEMVALNLTDVHERVGGYAVDIVVKGGRPTEVAVPGPAGEALARWLEARPPTPSKALLVREGLRVSRRTVNRILARLTKTAQVTRISAHGLRHTCATLLLDAGVSLWDVQAHLRHRNIESTLRYDRARRARAGKAALRLVETLTGPAGEDLGEDRSKHDPVMDARWRDRADTPALRMA